jgi:tetratricopeptide (TPR) repeat protein
MFDHSLHILQELDDEQSCATLSIDIGNKLYEKQLYNSAVDYYSLGTKFLEKLLENDLINKKTPSFWQKYIFKDTISDHFQQSVFQFSKFNVNQEKLAKMYDRIGNINRRRGDWEMAIQNHKKTLVLFRSIGDLKKIAIAYTNLGIDYCNFRDWKKALYFHNKSLDLLNQIDELKGQVVVLSNIGKLYDEQSDLKRALIYYKRSLKISQNCSYKIGIGRACEEIGKIYRKQKDLETANKYFKKAKKIGMGVRERNP